ncbi:hypothetical protein JHK82_056309 [Glycine max]|nr:hypothetical protein GLYMA_20G132851v4 [Glycine max]KAG5077614.1 hypothetical protein JHK82_056309 [Glycine max]KAH1035921.1 hypothetical protein GYH30_055736 [Glycine max]
MHVCIWLSLLDLGLATRGEPAEEVGMEEGRTVLVVSWKEGEVRKPVMATRRLVEEEV